MWGTPHAPPSNRSCYTAARSRGLSALTQSPAATRSVPHQASHATEGTKESRGSEKQTTAFAVACKCFSLPPGADALSDPALSWHSTQHPPRVPALWETPRELLVPSNVSLLERSKEILAGQTGRPRLLTPSKASITTGTAAPGQQAASQEEL